MRTAAIPGDYILRENKQTNVLRLHISTLVLILINIPIAKKKQLTTYPPHSLG